MRKRIKQGVAWLLSIMLVSSALQPPAVTTRAEEGIVPNAASGSALVGGNVDSNTTKSNGISLINEMELESNISTDTAQVGTEDDFLVALEDSSISIIELTTEITLSRTNSSTDDVFVINRPVTITGHGIGGLRLERSGIVLGGDVTFKDISIYVASPVRNAIIANGYALTIENVSIVESAITTVDTYTIDLFCGGITDYNGGNADEIPKTGSHGSITMKGTNTIGGNIFAGSLSDVGDGVVDTPNTYNGNVTIILEKDATGFSNIYAHGAREDRSGSGNGSYNKWISDATLYTVSGDVTIQLNECTNSITVDGATGEQNNATFIYTDDGTGNRCEPALYNVDSIKLVASDNNVIAHLAPNTTQTSFSTLSVPENTRLSFVNMGDEILASSLEGGGELVLKEASENSQKLMLGTATGTTKVAVEGVNADGTGSTGGISPNRTCITVTDFTSEGEFYLMPNSNSPNMFLEEDGSGNWVTKLGESSVKLEEIIIESSFVVEKDEDKQQVPIPVTVTYGEGAFLDDIPMTVTVNGKETFIKNEGLGYNYFTGTTSNDIVIWFYVDTLYIESYANTEMYPVPAGKYEISITIPANNMADGKSKTISFVLTVVCDATKHTGGTATCNSPAICTVCGTAYGETKSDVHYGTITENNTCSDCGESVQKAASITYENGMVENYADFSIAIAKAQTKNNSTVTVLNAIATNTITINGGTFTIDIGNRSIGNRGSGIFQLNSGTVTITNGTMESAGTAIQVNGGILNIKDSTIIGNLAIEVTAGTVHIESSLIRNGEEISTISISGGTLEIGGNSKIQSDSGKGKIIYKGGTLDFSSITTDGYTISNQSGVLVTADNIILPGSGYVLTVNGVQTDTIEVGETATITSEYTVTYTDGVDGEEIFADETYTVLKDSDTPAFEGKQDREGYVFIEWSPKWSEKVTQNVEYVAIWKPLPSYTILYEEIGEGTTLKHNAKLIVTDEKGEELEGTIEWLIGDEVIAEDEIVANTLYELKFTPINNAYAELTIQVMPIVIHKFEESVKTADKKVVVSKTCVEGTHENLHETLDCVEMQYVLSLEYVNCYYNNEEYPATVDALKEIVYKKWNASTNEWNVLEAGIVPKEVGTYRVSFASLEDAYIKYEIMYLETEAEATAETGWVKEAIITAPEGFTISATIFGEYKEAILITENSASDAGTVVIYYLKDENGYITDAKTITVKVSNECQWTYEQGENKIIVACIHEACESEDGVITISAPTNLTYDGTAKSVIVENSSKVTTPMVMYEQKNGGSWERMAGVPVEVGTYKAAIIIENAVTSVEYTIVPAPTAAPEVTATPVPTVVPEVTATPVPTVVPEVTATPVPTVVPEVTAPPVPKPTIIVKPTATPKPTVAPAVTATPIPTAAPEAIVTPAPTATPTPKNPDIITEEDVYTKEEQKKLEEFKLSEVDLIVQEKVEALAQEMKKIFNNLSEQAQKKVTENITLEKAPAAENSLASTLNNNPIDLMLKSLSIVEQNRLRTGEQVKFSMDIENLTETVSKQKKDLAEQTIQDINVVLNDGKQNGAKYESEVGMYFELNLTKQIGNEKAKRIARPQGMIDVSMQIPENLWNKKAKIKRLYQVIGIYNGKSILIDAEFNVKTNTLSFKTNRFATFALVYTDVPIEK